MKIFFKTIALLSVLSLGFTSCSKENSKTSAAPTRNTLVIANFADAKTLDPHGSNDSTSSAVIAQVYDRLLEFDHELNIVPGLAESWNQKSDTSYLFNLRKNVEFHNGEKFTAKDVKYSLERMKKSPRVKHILEAVDSIEVIDDYTVQINTSAPFAPLLKHLAHPTASIINQKAVEEFKESYGQNPVGTGAYKFASWNTGDKINLKSNEKYWKGQSPIPNIVFRAIAEATNRTIGLETGEVDIALEVSIIDKERIRNSKDLVLVEAPGLNAIDIAFNNIKAPFDNPKVRRAISKAIDVPSIIDAVYSGSAVKANSPVAPNVFGYSSDVKEAQYNPQKAKELLAEAGYKNGLNVTLELHDDQLRKDIATIVQAQLKDIGVNMEIEILEFGTSLERTAKGEYQMGIFGWTSVTADADYGLYPRFHSKNHGEFGNRVRFTNARVDELLDLGRSTMDLEKRKEIYREATQIIEDETPLFPLLYPTARVAYNKRVKNFAPKPSGIHSLYKVSF